MQAIWKYEVPVTDGSDIDMPAGAKVLTVQVQHQRLCLWVIVNPASPVETRRFKVIGTGHEHDECLTALTYIGTAQMAGGALVWHVFEERR